MPRRSHASPPQKKPESAQPQPAPAQAELVALLDRLGGAAVREGLRRIAEDPRAIERVAREIATSASVEALRKLARTSDVMVSGRVEADFAYVGLPGNAGQRSFQYGFEHHVRPRVGKRADGFVVLFDRLKHHARPLIIETGCLRVPGNWDGDGQSTFLFDWYARETHGSVLTIDINADSIDSARRACSGVTSAIHNDSVATLDMLSSRIARPAALLYLDSFDLDLSNPMPSAIHHAMELAAASRLIGPGTIVCVDDFDVEPLGKGGKGLIVDQYMHAIRADVLYSGYQKIWQIPG